MRQKNSDLAKKITCVCMMIVLLLQTFSRAAIVVNFYVNQDYIAKNLCENRNKPKLNCCGKCQLNKKLHTEDKKEKELPDQKGVGTVVLSSKSFYATVPSAIATLFRNTFYNFSENTEAGQASSFFHPPDTGIC